MDVIDRKILGLLGHNCRLSFTSIGEAVRLSKDAVSYRIRQLEERGVIKQYLLLIDARCLGFTRHHLLLRVDASRADQEVFMKAVAQHPFVMWVNSFIGCYDFQIIVDARSSFHLHQIKSELFSLCRNKIKHYTLLAHISDLEFTNLIPAIDIRAKFDRNDDGSFAELGVKRSYPVSPHYEEFPYGRGHLHVLKALADNPRASITDIAHDAGLSRLTTRNYILALLKSGVIRSFGSIVDPTAFGRLTYYLLIRLDPSIPPHFLLKPFKKLSNIFYSGHMLGSFDMILYLNAESPQELTSSIDLLRRSLEPYVVDYNILIQEKVYFWRHFTRGIYDDCISSLNPSL